MSRRKKRKGNESSRSAKHRKVNRQQLNEQTQDRPDKTDAENTSKGISSSAITSHINPEVLQNIPSSNKVENSSTDSKAFPFTTKTTGQAEKMIEEVAEDMVDLIEWSKKMEKKHEEMLQQVHRLQQDHQEGKRQHAIALNKVRVELLGERKAFAVRSVFEAILPTLDSLQLMKKGLSKRHKQMHSQLEGIISSLKNVIQSLGFSEFKVEEGTLFDPSHMECFGYGEGEPETVIAVVQPGFKAGDAIIRPCKVVIAK